MSGRVLVVEDDDLAAVTTVRILERAGYDVRRARTAIGVDTHLAGQWRPDCIVLDRYLGGDDGIAIAARLRERFGADCPRLVLLSGDPPSETEQRLVAVCLLKPTDIRSLLAAVAAETPPR